MRNGILWVPMLAICVAVIAAPVSAQQPKQPAACGELVLASPFGRGSELSSGEELGHLFSSNADPSPARLLAISPRGRGVASLDYSRPLTPRRIFNPEGEV